MPFIFTQTHANPCEYSKTRFLCPTEESEVLFKHCMGKCCLMPQVRVEQERLGIGGGEIMQCCVCVGVFVYVCVCVYAHVCECGCMWVC